jgi:hypothetical protein
MMSDRQRGVPEEVDRRRSRLLFIVARGHAELRAAIECALRGLAGVEVIEDRRRNRRLLSRTEPEPKVDDRPTPGDPDSDHPAGPVPTLAISNVPGRPWPTSLRHRV